VPLRCRLSLRLRAVTPSAIDGTHRVQPKPGPIAHSFILGTSRGKVNNAPNDPFHYDVPTIFNVLEELDFTPWGELVTWGVYNDTILPASFISGFSRRSMKKVTAPDGPGGSAD
jgi:hypothetical protein